VQRFHEILVLAPPDEATPQVIARAAELAERNRARLTLFDVVPGLNGRRQRVIHGDTTIDLQELLVDTRRRELEELASRVMTVETRVAVDVGVRFVSIIQRVIQFDHDLVIGAPDSSREGFGLRGATTTLHLLRKCPAPVWVDDPTSWGRKHVVVAVGPFEEDRSVGALNQMLLELGTSLARIQGGDVHMVHSWRLEGEHLLRNSKVRLKPSEVDELVDQERFEAEAAFTHLLDTIDMTGLEPHLHLRHGRASDVIAQVVEEVRPSVVVMGTLARAGLSGLIIGNTAERVLSDLDASVIAVKPPGFVTPVGPP
jgi:nucleotide-binding universal stress UspA family protein